MLIPKALLKKKKKKKTNRIVFDNNNRKDGQQSFEKGILYKRNEKEMDRKDKVLQILVQNSY